MIHVKLLLYVSNFLLLYDQFTFGQEHSVNSPCTVNDWRGSRGICKPLRQCGAVISDLRSDVQPTLCRVVNHKAVVCCPTEPRISEIMCDNYKEILRERTRPNILLPIEFLPEEEPPKEIECHVLKNALITGGREAKADEFPHMAGLGWGSNPGNLDWKCGGTLISDQYVLTAAHCIDTAVGRPSYVLLGDVRKDLLENRKAVSTKRVVVKIADHIKHPGYRKPSSYNDIALLRLETKVTLSRSILPACLPQPHFRLENKVNLTTLGWGLIGTGQGSADILQAVNLDRFSMKECNDIYADNPDKPYRYKNGILRTQLCAGDKRLLNRDSCNGDSGGPITVRNDTIKCLFHVMGITSFGAYICGIQPGVYTNVQSYLDWIEQNVWSQEMGK